jgi:hypothetical protein
MVETLGDAKSAGWRVKAQCSWGPKDSMKRVRECVYSHDLDLDTLIWTRGKEFPLSALDARLKCPQCCSRRVRLAFVVPGQPFANVATG